MEALHFISFYDKLASRLMKQSFFRALLDKFSPVRNVIVVGSHSKDWMAALGPRADVWKSIRAQHGLTVSHVAGQNQIAQCAGQKAVLIPLMEAHTLECIKVRWRSAAMLAPDAEVVETFADKARFSEYVERTRLSHLCPRTYRSSENARFPCILKRTDLNAGNGVCLIGSDKDFHARLNDKIWKDQAWLLQELIPGEREYVAHCVCKKGRILWHCVYEYQLESATTIRTGKYQVARKVSITANQLKQIESLMRPLKYSGPCNIDFKLSETGNLLVFEVNPRLGGSLMKPENVTDLQAALSCIIKQAKKARPKFSTVGSISQQGIMNRTAQYFTKVSLR